MRAITFPIVFAAGMLRSTDSYEEIVRAQIIDCVMTNRYERVMREDYGCDVQSVLFAPSESLNRTDTAQHIKRVLTEQVKRAVIRDVVLATDLSFPNIVYIKITYSTQLVDGEIILQTEASRSE